MTVLDKIDYLSAVVSIVDVDMGSKSIFLMKIVFFADLELEFDIPLMFRTVSEGTPIQDNQFR